MKRGRHQRADDLSVDSSSKPSRPMTLEELEIVASGALDDPIRDPRDVVGEIGTNGDSHFRRPLGEVREIDPEALQQIRDYVDESVSESAEEVDFGPILDLDYSIEMGDPDQVGRDLWRGRTRAWSVKVGEVPLSGEDLDETVYDLPIYLITDDFETAAEVFAQLEKTIETRESKEGRVERVFLVEHAPDEIYLMSGLSAQVEYQE